MLFSNQQGLLIYIVIFYSKEVIYDENMEYSSTSGTGC